MTLLAQLVAVSERVGATPARLTKVRELAQFLRNLPAEEISIPVHYLSGETPQGRSGIGYALLQQATTTPAASEGSLSIAETDRSLCALLERHGFVILKRLVYTPSLAEKLPHYRFRSWLSRFAFYAMHYADVWTGRGGRLLVWSQRPM